MNLRSLFYPERRGPGRDVPVDVLRGGAIALMVLANMAPALLLPPAPGWFRFLSTLAAPVFVMLAGMMVALSRTGKGRTLGYMAERGLLVIALAFLLDIVANDCVPFISMDVLYLIGLSLPLAFLYLGLPERKRLWVIAGILAAAPILYLPAGYPAEPLVLPLGDLANPAAAAAVPLTLTGIAASVFFCGWFPVFPWLALSLAGAELGMYRWGRCPDHSFRLPREGRYGLALSAFGGALWLLVPGEQYVRHGYVELFYPPVTGILVFMIGLVILAFCLLDCAGDVVPEGLLQVMGECSLALYVLHILIIALLIEPLGLQLAVAPYLGVYCALLVFLTAIAFLLRHLRSCWKNQPYLVRFLIGG